MKRKYLIVCVLVSALALLTMTGCGKAKMSSQEIHDKLVGVWMPLDDPDKEVDENGNVTKFSVYEFTDKEFMCYIVYEGYTETYDLGEYQIQSGDFMTLVDNKPQYAKIEFTESGNLLWGTNAQTTEYRPATAFEILDNGVPVVNVPEDDSVMEHVSSVKESEAAETAPDTNN